MGKKFSFQCKKCGYAVDEICGGIENGMLITLETHICLDCKELVDIESDDFRRELNLEMYENNPLDQTCSHCQGRQV